MKTTPLLLRISGWILLLIGLVGAYYGPLEIYVFYIFAKGGQFNFDGFGMGSFWFATLVVLNCGYYLVAILLIPLGWGFIRLKSWVLTLTRLYLRVWLGFGSLLMLNIFMLTPSLLKNNLVPGLFSFEWLIPMTVFLFFLVLLPLAAMWFYQSPRIKQVFELSDPGSYWLNKYPFPLLSLLMIELAVILIFHLAIFFQGMFPLFGQILIGRPSAYWISFCIVFTMVLIYGTIRLEKWAWWGSLLFFVSLSISTILTYSKLRFYDIVLLMHLPDYEMGLINKMVMLHDWVPVTLLVAPLLATLVLLIYTRDSFKKWR